MKQITNKEYEEWQKCGYILESMNTELGLSVEFFDECRKHISKAKHTLVRNSQNNILNKRWNLYISQKKFHSYKA
ncbi:MAG: hypothetical protein K6F64_09240 [Clostridia bacterium]|nr:hypothetical protein [Clostridia bacterium]